MEGNNDQISGYKTRINIKSNDRVTFIGSTGSGKTYLCQYLLSNVPKLLFIDPKCEHLFKEVEPIRNAEDVIRKGNAEFIHYQPFNIREEETDKVCKYIYDRGNLTVVFDEVARMVTPRMCEWHERLLREGRSRGIGVWHCIQRPIYIDNYILSETEHYFIFRLSVASDRKKLAGILGDGVEKSAKLRRHYFLYWSKWNQELREFLPITDQGGAPSGSEPETTE